MVYTSKKSERFQDWLDELTPEKIILLVKLESAARTSIHQFDLMGDIPEQDIHALARAVKTLVANYDN